VNQKLETLDWPGILNRLESYATSELCREILREMQPLDSPVAAEDAFRTILEIQNLLKQGPRPYMESLDLFFPWHQRLAKEATLKTLELKDVRHFCMEAIALHEVLSLGDTPWVKERLEFLFDASEPLSAIDQLMSPEGEIRTDASETLYQLYREKGQLARQIQNTLDRLVKQNDMDPILQERFVTNREGRWVLPVKGGMQHQFEGIIHGASQSKQTVYMEPKEIIASNNRLREVEVGIDEEIERLLTQLSGYLHTLTEEFEKARETMLEMDEIFAKAQMAFQMEAHPCRFSADEIVLIEARHPLLSLNPEQKVIPNSVHLDSEKRILLLSGPNAGGKTVLLKSIGLAAQMARCGLLICAEEGSSLPFFKRIHVAVGDAQSVDAQLSTFAAHLKILNSATEDKGPDTLLLIDEICGSTDPEEGTALARSFIKAYSGNRVLGVITSHLGPLKLGWTPDSGVVNGSLEYDNRSGRPTYQFIMGVPGQSLALQTAKRVGVKPEIVEQAMDFLSPETKRYQENLEQIEEMKGELRKLKDQLLNESHEMKKQKQKYDSLIDKFGSEKERMLEQARVRAERKIDRLIETAKVDEVFRKHENLEKVKSQLPEVVKAPARSAMTEVKVDSPEAFAKAYPPGAKVYAPSIGKDAVVQGEPGPRGEVPVLSASMRLLIPWDQLRPPQVAPNKTFDLVRKSHKGPISSIDTDRVVDVRGLRVDEALRQIEEALDIASLQEEDRLKIVHGHGTDTLKKSIRSYLSRSLYVKKWQAGNAETGGDGVTWAEIKD
jgi:DNA mismatch repair protein MutS2